MASRNLSGGMTTGGDSDSDTEVTTLTGGAGSKPFVNYGDRMPYRQGMFYCLNYIAILGYVILFRKDNYILSLILTTSNVKFTFFVK